MGNIIQLINQLVEIQQKLVQDNAFERYERNLNRINSILEDEGFLYKYPLGESYTDTRTDCEANIVGKEGKKMVITQVIKPIVYKREAAGITLVQKGIVIVEKK